MSQDALDLLLSGVKDQGQRKQITTAYYAFASGDPETFAVQFAVLLRAHATGLKHLSARLEKALSAETRKLGDLVISHQSSVHRMASLLDQESRENGVGEGTDAFSQIKKEIQAGLIAQSAILTSEIQKIPSAVASHDRIVHRLAAHRIIIGLILSYTAGAFSVLAFQHVLSQLFASIAFR
jgi:hypothetical protein